MRNRSRNMGSFQSRRARAKSCRSSRRSRGIRLSPDELPFRTVTVSTAARIADARNSCSGPVQGKGLSRVGAIAAPGRYDLPLRCRDRRSCPHGRRSDRRPPDLRRDATFCDEPARPSTDVRTARCRVGRSRLGAGRAWRALRLVRVVRPSTDLLQPVVTPSLRVGRVRLDGPGTVIAPARTAAGAGLD